MKIAIVTGGFEGIRRQKKIWDLEREVEKAEHALMARVELTARARADLRRLQQELINTARERYAMRMNKERKNQ